MKEKCYIMLFVFIFVTFILLVFHLDSHGEVPEGEWECAGYTINKTVEEHYFNKIDNGAYSAEIYTKNYFVDSNSLNLVKSIDDFVYDKFDWQDIEQLTEPNYSVEFSYTPILDNKTNIEIHYLQNISKKDLSFEHSWYVDLQGICTKYEFVRYE